MISHYIDIKTSVHISLRKSCASQSSVTITNTHAKQVMRNALWLTVQLVVVQGVLALQSFGSMLRQHTNTGNL